MSAHGPATEAGRESAGVDVPAERFGPNSAELAAFVEALHRLTPAQWRKVVATRRAAALVTRDGGGQPADEVRSLLRGLPGGGRPADPMSNLAGALAAVVQDRSDEEVVAAWQAASALARRRQLSALTFAAHYVSFASVIPPLFIEELPAGVQLFAKALKWLGASQWRALARPWTLDREMSASLLQAAMKSAAREAEEAAALAALAVVAKHLPGDAGWAAVKTAVHAGRVLSCRGELTADQLTRLWAPLEDAIPLRSLDDQPASDRPPKAAAKKAVKATPAPVTAPKKRPAPKRGPLYGPNTAEVTAFVKTVPALTAIQWLRILDRRQLVASITRERSAEPAAVVMCTLAAIRGTREMDLDARCRVVSAVERAAYALESKDRLPRDEALHHYGALADVIPFDEVEAGQLPARLADLNPEEWTRLAGSAAEVNAVAVSPLVSAGEALADHLADRSEEETVVAWHALTALIGRHLLSPIKFAVSYAPFASAVPVIKPKSITPAVQRYLTAVGRLSANQCALLAEPWLIADDVSNVLSRALADGGARAAEEAVALTALVTVPMRLTGDSGWAAAKTAAFGARVIASRAKVSDAEFKALWKPLERAIPSASLDAGPRSKS